MPDFRTVSIIGCGYTGIRLALRWQATGARVRGFASRTASLAAIRAAGIEALALDLDQEILPLELSESLVYYSVPPEPTRDGDPRLERFLAAMRGLPARVVYLSTTGVYGDHGGAPVDETTPVAPQTPRARRRVTAEALVRAWCEARTTPWCILRVAGIYGPGRLPLERLRRREPAIRDEEATPTNRIHVTDLVTVCRAAGTHPQAGNRIYNVSDGSADSQTAFLQRVARLTGLAPPPLITREAAQQQLSAATWSFLGESRRVGNARLRDELGVSLAYADLDAGIRASLEGPVC